MDAIKIHIARQRVAGITILCIRIQLTRGDQQIARVVGIEGDGCRTDDGVLGVFRQTESTLRAITGVVHGVSSLCAAIRVVVGDDRIAGTCHTRCVRDRLRHLVVIDGVDTCLLLLPAILFVVIAPVKYEEHIAGSQDLLRVADLLVLELCDGTS